MKRFLYAFIIIGLTFLGATKAGAQTPIASFTTTTTPSGCVPFTLTFVNTSQNTVGATYTWIFGTGTPTTVTTDSITTAFFNNGNTDVTLIVTNANGNADTVTATGYVHSVAHPAVSFTATSVSGCAPLHVCFNNTSVSGTAYPNYHWDFGGPIVQNPSTVNQLANPCVDYNYSAPGDYSVTLIETDSGGCTGFTTQTAYIHVSQPPVACVTSSAAQTCTANTPVCFNAGCSTGAATYSWNFGGGTFTAPSASPTVCHTFNTPGTYVVQVVAISAAGCTDTATITENIGVINADFTLSPTGVVCAGTFITITDASTSSVGQLTYSYPGFGNSANLSISFPATACGPQTITEIITAPNGCHDTVSHTITVDPGPTVSFTADTAYSCIPPLLVHFTSTVVSPCPTVGGPYVYTWNSGDAGGGSMPGTANPSYTYTAAGVYTPSVSVTDANLCSASFTLPAPITIEPPVLTVNATPHACVGRLVTFTTTLAPSISYTVDSVHWGDGTSDNLDSHTYGAPGTYTITVFYHAGTGCNGTGTATVLIGNVLPDANPTATDNPTCPNTWVVYSANCTNCSSYTWSFGGGNPPTSANPTDSSYYTIPNTYVITLLASNNGCDSTYTIPVVVTGPSAGFTYTLDSCSNRLSYHFTDQSIGSAPGSITGHLWTFGDATTSTATNPEHVFAAVGCYNVTDTVYDANGCKNWKTIQVCPYALPTNPGTFFADDTTACVGQLLNFTGPVISQTPLVHFVNYTWYFSGIAAGFPESVGTQIKTHAYPVVGHDTVTLIITDEFGCKDTLTRPDYITVSGPSPHISVNSPASGCSPLAVSFTDNATDITGVSITERNWFFESPDQSVGNVTLNSGSPNATHTYAPGTYTVIVLDTDAAGCGGADTFRYINVYHPHANFTASDSFICPLVPIYFHGDTTGGLDSFNWKYGGPIPNTGFGLDVSHAYPSSTGSPFTVSLVVTDIHGCHDTLVRPGLIHVQDFNGAGFSLSDTFKACPPLFENVTADSVDASYTYLYNYGDGFISSSTIHSYNFPTDVAGLTITQIVTNPKGCQDSAKHTIVILGPVGALRTSLTTACNPANVDFTVDSLNIDSNSINYVFLPDGQQGFSTSHPHYSFTFDSAGIYTPIAILSSSGCNVTITGPAITILQTPNVTASPDQTLCKNASVELHAFGAGANGNYVWTPPSGLSTVTGDSTSATPQDTTRYVITGTAANGCSDTATVRVNVLPLPQITISSTPPAICFGAFATLVANGANNIGNYVWTGGDLTSPVVNDSLIVSPATSTIYTVTVTGTNGCIGTNLGGSVTVNALPVITHEDYFNCEGRTQQLTISNSTGVHTTFAWSPGNSLSCTDCTNPVTNTLVDVTYNVVGTDDNGCIDSGTVSVKVIDSVHTSVNGDTVICIGQTAILSASGGIAYLWSPSTGLDQSDTSYVIAKPDSTTTYHVYITENQCFTDSSKQVTVFVNQVPIINLPDAVTIIAGNSIQISTSVPNEDSVTYTWAPAATLSCERCPNPIATPTATTTYTVSVGAPGGCIANGTVTITLRCDNSQVWIPNTFTPNGDGNNDRFYPSSKGISKITQFTIFNRWGEVVYDQQNVPANDAVFGWDGTFKGHPLEPDVFVYYIQVQCEVGGTFEYKGDVSIVR